MAVAIAEAGLELLWILGRAFDSCLGKVDVASALVVEVWERYY